MNGLNNRPFRHPVSKPRILPDFQAAMRNRRSHLLTRAVRVSILVAISLPLRPVEAKRITLARSTIRRSVLVLRIQRSKVSFSSAES